MPPRSTHDAIRVAAEKQPVLLRAADLEVSHDAMARMENEGVLARVIPGVYIGAVHRQHPLLEAAAWTLRFPRAVVGLITAAVHHDLTDSFSNGTWLYVPKGGSRPRSRVAVVHALQSAEHLIAPRRDRENGVDRLEVHGVRVRITGPDRTALDLWRFPRRVTPETALVALRRRTTAPGFQIPAFARLAKRLRVWSRIEPVLQGMVLK